MGKFNLHRGSLQLRVLTLTLLFTLGVSIVITVSNMHQLNAEWERTTLLNAEPCRLQPPPSTATLTRWTIWQAGAPTIRQCAPTC